MAMALKVWKPRCLSSDGEIMMDKMAAGVVQQTKRMTMEMRTMTSIRSSGLCSDFLRDVLEICLSNTGFFLMRQSDDF